MTHLDLNKVDVDGALREAAEDAGLGRADFFKKGAVAGAGVVAGGALFGPFLGSAQAAISSTRKSLRNDIKIGNFALTLEFLESEFYRQANANKPFRDDRYRVFSEITGAHEDAHVRALRKLLGSAAVKKPTFDFADTVTDAAKFAATAQVLEDTGVSAYAGQGPNLKTRSIVQSALAIHSVEARHAAWIRFLNSNGAPSNPSALPAPRSFDRAATERQVLRAVTGTGFIKNS